MFNSWVWLLFLFGSSVRFKTLKWQKIVIEDDTIFDSYMILEYFSALFD